MELNLRRKDQLEQQLHKQKIDQSNSILRSALIQEAECILDAMITKRLDEVYKCQQQQIRSSQLRKLANGERLHDQMWNDKQRRVLQQINHRRSI